MPLYKNNLKISNIISSCEFFRSNIYIFWFNVFCFFFICENKANNKPVENLVSLQQVNIQYSNGICEWKISKDPHDPVRVKLKKVLVGTGNQLADASATPVGKVSKGHARSTVGQEGLVNVPLVGVIVANQSGHTVETLSLILAEM